MHVATVVDVIGQKAKELSTKGALRVIEFVRKYMVRARGLVWKQVLCVTCMYMGALCSCVGRQLVRLPHSLTNFPSTDNHASSTVPPSYRTTI